MTRNLLYPLIDVPLADLAGRIGFAQPLYALVAVVAVFGCSLVGVADNDALVAVDDGLIELVRVLFKRQDPVLNRFGLFLYAAAEDELVPCLFEQRDVPAGQQPGIGHDDKVRQREPLREVVYYRYQCPALVLVSVEDIV